MWGGITLRDIVPDFVFAGRGPAYRCLARGIDAFVDLRMRASIQRGMRRQAVRSDHDEFYFTK